MSVAAPLISVGIPVRNGSPHIETALQSVLAQSYKNLDIIISDNASTDDTADIVRRCCGTDARVRYIHQQHPLTAYDNLQFVLREAKGEYFFWAAHDDTRSLDFAERLLKALQDRPDAVLAFGDLFITGDNGGIGALRSYEFSTTDRPKLLRLIKASSMQCFHIYGLWRTDILRRIPPAYCSWWPDLPIMTAAALLGSFIRAPGARFTYMEMQKTNLQRIQYQDLRDTFKLHREILQLLFASFRATSEVSNIFWGILAVCFILLRQIRRIPGFVLRRLGIL